ncbi:RidA family protein [Streptomyces sp. NPDC021100]|uniref:RidA family protein n=1 Tax=Streptomyces sp. NPDC021100 TaxID=3365114 RepID=UPI003788C991
MSAEREEGDPAHLDRLNPPELSPPRGFSHAVTTEGGRLVFLAGQTGLDGTGRVVPGGLPAQFERALTNLLTALTAAGGTPVDLARVTVYTTDVASYRARATELGAIWRRLAGRDYPAMALIGVVRLWDEEALVELDGVAVLP